MSIAFVAATKAGGSYSTPTDASLAGVGSDDVQIALLDTAENSGALTVPGWTQIATIQTTSPSNELQQATLYWRRGPGEFKPTATDAYWAVGIVAYSGCATTGLPYQSAQIGFGAAPTASVSTASTAVRFYCATSGNTGITPSLTPNPTARIQGAGSAPLLVVAASDDPVTPTTAATRNVASGNAANQIGATVVLAPYTNTAPNAPTLTSPATNATIDRSITQRFAWLFSDPDAGDSQSKFDLQWWPCDASWARTGTATTVTQTIPNQFYDFAAGYWAAGNYEWQVRTYDSQGVVGPWSSSSFFTAATAPTPPTITAPTSGGTVSNTQTVTWSEPNQDSYQIRRVADNAGSADTGTVYYDSGEVVDAVSRSATLTFETNNRWEHIEVRIKYSGLWSSWSDIRVDVSYTPPAAPTVNLTPDAGSGSLLVGINNPAPGAGQPATSYNDVYVDDGQGLGWERVATMLAPSTDWTYQLPVSGRDYSGAVKVVAVASNGTTSEAIA